MHRRSFLTRSGGLLLTVGLMPARATRAAIDRVGMGTVIFRNRFAQTRPKAVAQIENTLSLPEVPAYYRKQFGIHNLEFWSHHFESLERPYLIGLRDRVKGAGSELINVQVDATYDLASADEEERQRSLATVRQWIDAAALLGSRAVPGISTRCRTSGTTRSSPCGSRSRRFPRSHM